MFEKVVSVKSNASSYHAILGHELNSFDIEMPRYLIPELSKHRVTGFNTASSRAISYGRMRDAVSSRPFIFPVFAKKHTGMVAKNYFNPDDRNTSDFEIDKEIRRIWQNLVDTTLYTTDALDNLNVSKQMINRILEPYSYSKLIITSSFWQNFFNQRCSVFENSSENPIDYSALTEYERLMANKGDAEPNMMALADAIKKAYDDVKPKALLPGQWHLPNLSEDSQKLVNDYLESEKKSIETDPLFIQFNDYAGIDEETYLLVCISSANSARTSYTLIGSKGTVKTVQEDIELFRDLLNKKHMTPHEHAQRAMFDWENASFQKTFVLTKKRLDAYLETCHAKNFEYETQYEYHAVFGSRNKLFMVTEYGWCANYRGFVSARFLFDSLYQQ